MKLSSTAALLVLSGLLSLSACNDVDATKPVDPTPTGLAAPTAADIPAGVTAPADPSAFVTRQGAELRLGGQPYRFSGTNNYYLEYSSKEMVDAVLETAAKNKIKVVRAWGYLDIGKSDGSDSLDGKGGKVNGIYFQSYDGGALPTVNEGEDGLKHLDYAVYKAGQLGIKLVIPFTNNWATFGGMDQYTMWRGGKYHDDFYTDPVIQTWYKWWMFRLMYHKNAYTGVRYINDPSIMMWELANEPRCKGSAAYPPSPTCSPATITRWADEMTTFIKSFDRLHLVGVGDEGFYNDAGAGDDWTRNGGEGIDSVALGKLPNVDVTSAHLYPGNWKKTPEWGTAWIERHQKESKAAGKPFFLGEFGWEDKATRDEVYKTWTRAIETGGGNDLFWMLSDKQDSTKYYADYDGYTVYCPSASCTVLSQHAQRMAGETLTPAPTAAADAVTINTGKTAVLKVLANDLAAPGQTLNPATIDLDPVAPGIQSSKADGSGLFMAQPDGTVLFRVSGAGLSFSGSYTVQDSLGQTTNAAALKVDVPNGSTNTGGPQTLYSFEDGVQGWEPGSWQKGIGSVTQTKAFHTEGDAGLHITALDKGGWYGLELPKPLDLSGKTHLKFDLKTGTAGTSQNVVFKVGSTYQWCQMANWGSVNANATTTVDVDLSANFDCPTAGQKPINLADIRALYVFFGPGEFDLDNVRAE